MAFIQSPSIVKLAPAKSTPICSYPKPTGSEADAAGLGYGERANVGQTEGGWWSKTGAAISLDVVDNTIFSVWSAKGVKFVDRQVLEGKIRAGAAASGDIGNDIAKEFGSLCGADIVIVGRAIASDIGNTYPGSKLRTLQANTSIRAINVNNAEMLAAVTTTKSASHLNAVTGGTKALELVAKSAAEQMLTQVLDRWSKDVGGSGRANLTFNGVKKSKQLRLLKAFLTNEICGVENVIQRSFKKGKALFEVKYKGSMQQLVEELEEKEFPGFAMSLEEMNADAATCSWRLNDHVDDLVRESSSHASLCCRGEYLRSCRGWFIAESR